MLDLGLGLTSRAVLVGDFGYLLDDRFTGDLAPLAGRAPTRGSAWAASGASGVHLVAGGGHMYQSDGGPAAYAIALLDRQPREIGCRFVVHDVHVGVTLGGTYVDGSRIVLQISPSRSADLATVDYTTLAGDGDLVGAAISLAAAIAAHPLLIAAGVTAVAVGPMIRVRAAECPRIIAVAALSGTITLASAVSDTPTLACWVAGQDFIAGMLHFRLAPDGYLDWSIYQWGPSWLTASARTTIGLSPNVEYTYTCSIDGEEVRGAVVSPSGETLSQIVASDARVPDMAGRAVFFETGMPDLLHYRRVWAR